MGRLRSSSEFPRFSTWVASLSKTALSLFLLREFSETSVEFFGSSSWLLVIVASLLSASAILVEVTAALVALLEDRLATRGHSNGAMVPEAYVLLDFDEGTPGAL